MSKKNALTNENISGSSSDCLLEEVITDKISANNFAQTDEFITSVNSLNCSNNVEMEIPVQLKPRTLPTPKNSIKRKLPPNLINLPMVAGFTLANYRIR